MASPGPLAVQFSIALRVRNRQNQARGNTRLAAIIAAREDAVLRDCARAHTLAALHQAGVSRADLIPAVVTMIRVSAGKLDDDGLRASLKRVRDGIAKALGVNDGGRFVRFRYGQRRGPKKHYEIRVRIERSAA